MIKTVGFFLLWLAGSAAAVGVAWTGVSIVDDELIDPAPANNQIAVGPSIAGGSLAAPSPTSTVSPSPTTIADPTATSIPGTSEASAVETPADSAQTPAPQATAAPTDAPATEPSPATSPAPTTTATPPPTPTTAPPTPTTAPLTPTTAPSTPTTALPTPTTAPAQTLTFNLLGGSTAISFSPAGAEVLWATPNPGFTVKIEPESPGIKVEFEADHHESRIDAWWAGGPRHEIRERPDD